jgi:uncharacterized protein
MLIIAMFFNVSGLIQEGIGATRFHSVGEPLELEDGSQEQVSGEVRLLRTKSGVLVFAHLVAVHPETCSRCLKPLVEQVHVDFEEEFLDAFDPRSAESPPADRDPDAFLIDERNLLDISEAVRQYREAAAAMQPLCRPDCRGLCPNCGRDLNAGDCNCQSDAGDSRWADLSALRATLLEGKD